MKRLINYGSIKQFHSVVKTIKHQALYVGEKDGEPIYDTTLKFPVIQAIASEKIHGTNAGVCYSKPDGLWVQSRSKIINHIDGHFGCSAFIYNSQETWIDFVNKLAEEYAIDLNENIISIYFEWCGEGIQEGKSAVSGLSKRAMIFQHFKVSPIKRTEEVDSIWLETKVDKKWISREEDFIYNIMNFKIWDIEIDFSQPSIAQNKMLEIIQEIEQNSPVGEKMGIQNNIGEGLVVTFTYEGNLFKFKVKGDKHSKSKVKKIKSVNIEDENAVIEFVNYACKPWRLEQMWDSLYIETDREPDIKYIGDFIKSVVNDILKEEVSIIQEKDLDIKKIKKYCANCCKKWYLEMLNNSI